ncbi:MAG: penicillin acylase family protein, partial [bacterium]
MGQNQTLKKGPVTLAGIHGRIRVQRNTHGIPELEAETFVDLCYGLGWVHACDRQLQTLLMRILLKGQAAEFLKNDAELIEIDKYMRSMNFLADGDSEVAKLTPDARAQMDAYAAGFNHYLATHSVVFEFRLLGYQPEPWDIKDTLLIARIIGFLGLADAQANMEKFLVQMIQRDISEAKIRELFPYLTDAIDVDLIKKVRLAPPLIPEAVQWLGKLPKFVASNNWAVSGHRTASGKPILCGDPHLEVNRLPSIWQETVMKTPANTYLGATLPGVPGIAIGRTTHLAWSATYSFSDMLDFRIEECRDGQYRRSDGWKPFQVREEVIRVKKGDPIVHKIYENEHGVLEGDPHEPGFYLAMNWSASRDCGGRDMNALLDLQQHRTVQEAMNSLAQVDSAPVNWVIADTAGNIGYQMSGRCFNRPEGVSGLMPLPGWEEKYNFNGYLDNTTLPSQYNPEDGIIVTANQDLNYLGVSRPINLAMGTYRADRARQLLLEKKDLTTEDMKRMHGDLYSLQAERFMPIITPLLPDTENGRLLKTWDRVYQSDSKGAMLFESVYLALIYRVFGDNGVGRAVVDHIMKETGLFNDYYANLDRILLGEQSAWFEGVERDRIFREAVAEGLDVQAAAYGTTRRVMMSHMLFGGQIPRIFGFDQGPIELPGCRATIPQG